MPLYMNPSSLQTPNDFKASGPLGGFLAGMNQDYANKITQQTIDSTNIQQQAEQQRLDEARQLQQSHVDAANDASAKALFDKGRYDDGTMAKLAASADTLKLAQDNAGAVGADVKAKMEPAQLWVQFANEAKQMGDPNPMDKNYRDWWEGWRQKMAPYAPNMPVIGDQGDMQKVAMQGQQAMQFIARANATQSAAINTPAHTQAMELGQQAQAAKSSDVHYTADQGRLSRDEVASIRADAQRDVQTMKTAKENAEKQQVEVDNNIIKRAIKNKDIDALAVGAAERLASKEVDDELKTDPGLKIKMMSEGGDALKQRLIDAKAEGHLPGYMRAKAVGIGGTSAPQATDASAGGDTQTAAAVTPKGPTITNKADYDKLPSGAVYTKDGVNFMRKK